MVYTYKLEKRRRLIKDNKEVTTEHELPNTNCKFHNELHHKVSPVNASGSKVKSQGKNDPCDHKKAIEVNYDLHYQASNQLTAPPC